MGFYFFLIDVFANMVESILQEKRPISQKNFETRPDSYSVLAVLSG